MAIALYRRYRPESFAEVIGQDHVTTPLRRALRAGRIGHAYLFSGPRGCGKTTSARILARCLNCEQGPTEAPCGQCDSCRDLSRDGSGSLDVVEIDAASHGGVDDARELRERASFAPVRDRYKVFIIDEAHMVTSAGFNALLKLVEEPPEHVKFVFATTEPDKVIGTIRSRTHHYPFRLIPPQILTPYLEEISATESVNVGEGVLPLVVRAGGGSARDSMSVLDQLMAGAGEDGVDFATTIALLGFTDTALLDRAVTAIAQRDAAALYEAVEQVLATGHEPRRFVEDLLERVRDLIVLAAVPDRGADLLPQVPADELESMRAQSTLFAPADLSRCGDLIHETLSTMSGATSPRLHLELLAARLVLRDELATGGPAPADAGGGRASHPGQLPGGAPGQGAPSGGGPQHPGGGRAATGVQTPAGASGAREEARRIAQEKADASRQAREGRPQAPRREQASVSDAGPARDQAPQGQQRPQAAPAQQPASGDGGWVPAAVPGQGSASQDASRPPAPQESQAASVQPGPGGHDERADAPEQGAPSAAPAQQAAAGGPDADAVRGHWSAILDELAQIRRPSWALISQNAHVHEMRGTTLVLGFRTDGLVSAFHRGTAAENVADAVRRIMRVEVSVEAVTGEDPGPGGGGTGSSGPGGTAPGGGGPAAGGPGASGRGAGGPGRSDPGDTREREPGPGGDDWSRDSGAGAGGPRGDVGPRGEGAAQATAPARLSGAWGDAVPSATQPSPAARPDPVGPDRSGPQSSRPDGGAAPSARPGDDFPPEPDEDPYPPEPEDAYPPDPRDSYGLAPGPERTPPRSDGLSSAPAPSAGPPPSAGPAPSTRPAVVAPGPADAPSAGTAQTSAAPAPAVTPGDIPVVEDEGRDSLPEGEPRTYGQAALKRALAEGRVVHSRPATAPAPAPASQAGGTPPPETASLPGSTAAAGPASSPDAPAWSDLAAQSEASWSQAAPRSEDPAPSTEPRPPGDKPWSEALNEADPSSAPSAPPVPTGPRTGAALAREAAMASRNAGRRFGSGTPSQPEAPAPDADPTGGASRDDEDAVVATRNGREVIEKILGGKVLEIIDETQNR
ncbi:MAG TPA: DNA polymerase III subunit gamma and tau [Candidatus Brachybacterium merdavium]|uniref:DNA-directed DNA polymerase n=1 Tax=Candidatus Brachybacterium merdavium TaxID=2838513 RepID=A0A9D2LDZ5_9MICO|nr:DNA polymerase III subunit gamma and tau [Candidatus Brachybacterium merdavium]